MRYEDVRRLRGVEGFWLRLRLMFRQAAGGRPRLPFGDISRLSEHELRDIGLTGFERASDWWRFR
jgi:hypothetical protein